MKLYAMISGAIAAVFLSMYFVLKKCSQPKEISSYEILVLFPGKHTFYTNPASKGYGDCEKPFHSLHPSVKSTFKSEFCPGYTLDLKEVGYLSIASLRFDEEVFFYSINELDRILEFLSNIFGSIGIGFAFVALTLVWPYLKMRSPPLWR